MTAGRAISIAVWLLSLGSALLPAHRLHQPPGLDNLPRFLIALPVLFFGVGAFFGGYPFDSPRLRRWADKRWGDGTYVRFMQDLKPMLLFAAVPLAGGVVNVLRSHFTGAPVDFFYFGLSLSLAFGFLLARVVLSWRGLLMESRSSWARGGQIRAERATAGFLAAIRGVHATNLTAALAGAALVAGQIAAVTVAELLFAPPPSAIQSIGWVAMVLIFLITMPLFVVGWQHKDISSYDDARHAFKDMGRGLVRGLCWMLGAAAAGVAALILAAAVAFVRGLH